MSESFDETALRIADELGSLGTGREFKVEFARRLLAELAKAEPVAWQWRQRGWRPIESAPKDGSLILICRIGSQAYRSCGEWTWHRGGYWTTDFAESVSPESLMSGQPTHWQPLPPPPGGPK